MSTEEKDMRGGRAFHSPYPRERENGFICSVPKLSGFTRSRWATGIAKIKPNSEF